MKRNISIAFTLTISTLILASCAKELGDRADGSSLNFSTDFAGIEEVKSPGCVRTEEKVPAESIILTSEDGRITMKMSVAVKTNAPGILESKAGIYGGTDISSFTVAGYEGTEPWFPDSGDPVIVSPGDKFDDYLWVVDTWHTFYGYANIPDEGMSATIANNGVTLNCTEVTSIQTDPLLGVYEGYGDYTGTAAMTFYHPMSAVSFLVDDTIKSVSLEGVIASGTATMDNVGNISWNTTGATTKTVTLSTEDLSEEIVFYLIPQDLASKNVKVTLLSTIGGEDITFTATLNSGNWEAGKAYSYFCQYKEYSTGDRGSILGHNYVVIEDLNGQSIKWATMNVGSTSVYDYGEYYAWGETETKETYTEEKYDFPARGIAYNITPTSGFDVARVKWGSSWRMPTKDEFQNMINATYWAWDSTDKGYYVFPPDDSHNAGGRASSLSGLNKDDALLFFRAAGRYNYSYISRAGNEGYFWSSTYSSQGYKYINNKIIFIPECWCLHIDSNYRTVEDGYYSDTYYGYSIRPVSD